MKIIFLSFCRNNQKGTNPNDILIVMMNDFYVSETEALWKSNWFQQKKILELLKLTFLTSSLYSSEHEN